MTENKRMQQRIDTATNWQNNNPMIQPGEVCFIENSTDYRVNVSNQAAAFLDCQLFKGTDTQATSANNGQTTLQTYSGQEVGSWTANQGNVTPEILTIPNLVANAKLDFPKSNTKELVVNDWVAGRQLTHKLPHCIPVDLVVCIIRELAALLQANGTQAALRDAQSAILTSLELTDLNG